MVDVKTCGSTFLAYRRFYANRVINRATVEADVVTIRTYWPSALLRISRVPVPIVVRASDVDRAVLSRGIAEYGILVPIEGSALAPIMVSWWVCDALVPDLAGSAEHLGYFEGQRMVRNAE